VIPCPFVYSTGRQCAGHIVRIEAYKADIEWQEGKEGGWDFAFSPRSHYHLFCSERGNHAGALRRDDEQMKFHWRYLPDEIKAILRATGVGTIAPAGPPEA
jgi:hypothetical protein